MKNLSRRFGHAATDRQIAYLSQGEIDAAASRNDMLGEFLCCVLLVAANCKHACVISVYCAPVEFCKTAVASKAITWAEIDQEFHAIQSATEQAFNAAVNEPKILERQPLLDSVSAPEVRGARGAAGAEDWSYSNRREHKTKAVAGAPKAPAEVMRKHMTTVFDEALGGHSPAGQHAIYLGEDVRHGGYVHLVHAPNVVSVFCRWWVAHIICMLFCFPQ